MQSYSQSGEFVFPCSCYILIKNFCYHVLCELIGFLETFNCPTYLNSHHYAVINKDMIAFHKFIQQCSTLRVLTSCLLYSSTLVSGYRFKIHIHRPDDRLSVSSFVLIAFFQVHLL